MRKHPTSSILVSGVSFNGDSLKEIETKIMDVGIKKFRKSLRAKGAKFIEKVHYRRLVVPLDMRPNYIDEFIRIRTDGKRSTITYKYRKGKGLSNTEEIETEIYDYDKAVEIFSKVNEGGPHWFQENYVEKWSYKDAQVDICTWPLIPQFVEIEAPTEKKVRSTIDSLGVEGEEFGNVSMVKVYNRYGLKGRDSGNLSFRRSRRA